MKETVITIATKENRWLYKVVGAHGTVLMGRQRFTSGRDGHAAALISALQAVPYLVFCRATFGDLYGGRRLPVFVNTDNCAFVERLRNLDNVEDGLYPYGIIKSLSERFEIHARCIPTNNPGIQRMKQWYTYEERILYDISEQIETSISEGAKLA